MSIRCGLGKIVVLLVVTSLLFEMLVLMSLTPAFERTRSSDCSKILQRDVALEPLLVHKANFQDVIPITTRAPRQKYVPIPHGPGENGAGVDIRASDIRDDATKRRYEALEKKHGYNALASDLLSLHRTLRRDLTDPACATLEYPEQLPTASVVLPYRDELISTLLRTVTSVLDRSPPHLITDVILVDDGSTDESDKEAINRYIAFLPKVKVVRFPQSRGLMVARTEGARAARGDVVVIMDSHVEVMEGWLEPLLWRLKEKPRNLVFPSMDVIDGSHFEYHSVGRQTFLQGWDEGLDQYLIDALPEYLASLPSTTTPIQSPAYQGWAMAMRREYFLHLGGFDPGMELWGSEQYEVSFKVWMCGGAVELVPCSRAGHVYRSFVVWHATSRDPARGGTQRYNSYRVADVWMDEYGTLVKEANGNYTYTDLNTTEQKALRHKLQCGSFQSFLDKIRHLSTLYLPEDLHARGTITEVRSGRCLFAPLRAEKAAGLRTCLFEGREEFWEWSKFGELRHYLSCLTADPTGKVVTKMCDRKRFIKWTYTKDSLLRHEDTGKCLKSSGDSLILADCVNDDSLRWYWPRLPVKGR